MVKTDELNELGITATKFAREIRVPTNRITQIIAGKRGITADTALRIGKWFGTGPRIWMNLQQGYDLDLASEALSETLKTIKSREAA